MMTKRFLAVLVGVMLIGGIGLASSHQVPDQVMTMDHPLYDVKKAAEQDVEELAPNETAKAQAKLEQANKRAAEMRELAERNETDLANKTAGNYSEEMQELSDFGRQISDLAQKQKIDQLVANATMIHAEVLSTVYERVPEQAKAGISKALNQSVKGHQEAVAAMQARGENVDAMNITDRIPSDVRQQAGIDVGAMRDRAEAGQQERDGGQNETSSGVSQDGQDTLGGR